MCSELLSAYIDHRTAQNKSLYLERRSWHHGITGTGQIAEILVRKHEDSCGQGIHNEMMLARLCFVAWIFWLACPANSAPPNVNTVNLSLPLAVLGKELDFVEPKYVGMNSVLDLITQEEASQPTREFKIDVSSIFGRGPTIEMRPKREVATKNPFEIEIRFTAHGGRKINPESIEVLYWSDPRRSLTARLKTFYKDNVISVPAARAPEKKHSIMISVTDSEGYRKDQVFYFTVVE